jgi:hypothetical protein
VADPAGKPPAFARHDGIDLDGASQLARLARWRGMYGELFAALRRDEDINRLCPGKPFVRNGYYATPDAEIYAAMILDFQPSQIVEIGAGFSTLIARRTIQALPSACRLLVVDPCPRTEVRAVADTVLFKTIEAVSPDELPSSDRVLFFVDSSHIARPGGDVPHLYNGLLPCLPTGTLVHVHDVFIPYDYPEEYRQRLYTEQYVLQALLCHSPRYRVVFATYFMTCQYPEAMRSAFGDVVGRAPEHGGASLWFTVS